MASDNFAAVTNAELLGGMYGPNQYSQFQGRIPFPGYVGTPTDALGRPIQTPGTTLNQTAAQPQAAAAPDASAANANRIWQTAQGAGQGQYMNALQNSGMAPWQQQGAGGQSAQPASPGAAPGSLNNALAALSNPGPVTTPGATVPQSTVGSQPSVLQQFLANQRGGTGAANYSNQGFFDTLNNLSGGGSSSSLSPSASSPALSQSVSPSGMPPPPGSQPGTGGTLLFSQQLPGPMAGKPMADPSAANLALMTAQQRQLAGG